VILQCNCWIAWLFILLLGIAAVVAAIQKSSLANLQLKPLTYQELGSTDYLKRVAARWQRGARGKLYTKPTPLDTSEIMEQFRKMDDEYLQIKEMPDNSVQSKDLQEDQELVVVEVANETWETGVLKITQWSCILFVE
jgi:hypothetical protein